MTDHKIGVPTWAEPRKQCPICLRPVATMADESTYQETDTADLPPEWGGDGAPGLCWMAFGGECHPPTWWAAVTPLEVLRLRGERARIVAHLRRISARQYLSYERDMIDEAADSIERGEHEERGQ